MKRSLLPIVFCLLIAFFLTPVHAFAVETDPDVYSSWAGTWTTSAGDEITVTDVTDTMVTLVYHGYYARNTSDGSLYFSLPFLDDQKNSIGEDEEVIAQNGFRTVFTLVEGHLSMYYNDHFTIFDHSGSASPQSSASSAYASMPTPVSAAPAPFYGIWCSASKSAADVQAVADNLSRNGYAGQVFVTTDWDNLNTEFWYVVTAGTYGTEDAAKTDLSGVQALYPDAYVKYSGNYKGTAAISGSPYSAYRIPFYGIWCSASKSAADVQAVADDLSQNGFTAQVLVTTDWDNLNTEFWYVVTAGLYTSEEIANVDLPKVQALYPDAYIKYSGNFKGSSSASVVQPTATASGHVPFYGVWCSASKDYAALQQESAELSANGFASQIYTTTDWSNLNPEFWYVLTAGTYTSESAANAALPHVQSFYPDAYVKYSGEYIGG